MGKAAGRGVRGGAPARSVGGGGLGARHGGARRPGAGEGLPRGRPLRARGEPAQVIFDVATALVAFAIAAAVYPVLIRVFRRLKLGQPVQAELSEAHQRKAGTPTGGGILFLGLALLGGLLSLTTHRGALPATIALLLFGGLGLLDDLRKLRVGAAGIPARVKFPLQVLLALPVAALTQAPQHFVPEQLGWLYWPLAVGALVGAANAVNLTDGLDGLAGGLAVIALLGVSLGLPGASAGEKAVAMTLVGGLLAFLLYNRHPARGFMGG